MKPIRTLLLLALCLVRIPAEAAGESVLLGRTEEPRLVVHNRVLAKVNGKAISVIDIMKKMDVLFYRQFPQYATSVEARYQFFQINWKQVLEDLINKELVLADAEENKLPVTNGDIRQEMETMFGPNIIENLDKVGITHAEAWKIVQGDITLRRMVQARVNSKVIKKVTPQVVREAYQKYAENNIRPEQWSYQVLSIRDTDPTRGANTANTAYEVLQEGTNPKDVLAEIKKRNLLPNTSTVSLSEPFQHVEKEMAPAYLATLKELPVGAFSKPVAQQSRSDRSTVFRIFFLNAKREAGPIPYLEVENELRDNLIDQMVGDETDAYLKKLRRHFDIHEMKELPEGFQPFELR